MVMGLHSHGGRGRSGRRAPMAEINVTPLVDVMLVLLIIFMVTAPLLSAGVPVDLPDSRANALPQDEQAITISVDHNGAVFLDDEELGPGELPARLERISAGADGELPQVTLRGDKALDYGAMMAVMGELNRAGFNRIALVTNATVEQPAVIGGSDEGP